jgi:DNA modification methylase
MDPFNGLGSTAVACARLGVPDFIGADIDETYLEAAVERVRSVGKPRMAKAGLREEKRAAGSSGARGSGRAGGAGR